MKDLITSAEQLKKFLEAITSASIVQAREEFNNLQENSLVQIREQEEAEESISVNYQGEELQIGFNVSYLQDVLSVIDNEKVKITLHDSNSSAILEDPDVDQFLYVVMPMKL